jgi:hypothetical protein
LHNCSISPPFHSSTPVCTTAQFLSSIAQAYAISSCLGHGCSHHGLEELIIEAKLTISLVYIVISMSMEWQAHTFFVKQDPFNLILFYIYTYPYPSLYMALTVILTTAQIAVMAAAHLLHNLHIRNMLRVGIMRLKPLMS